MHDAPAAGANRLVQDMNRAAVIDLSVQATLSHPQLRQTREMNHGAAAMQRLGNCGPVTNVATDDCDLVQR